MDEALGAVVTVEVTRAVRSTSVSGVAVQSGQYIGMRDGDLVSAGDSANAVLAEALLHGGDISGSYVTLYWGADIEEADATEAASLLTAGERDVEVEVHYGGQPFYQYIASLE
jgi:dihydroxyacetone kinase-like predicted kinase